MPVRQCILCAVTAALAGCSFDGVLGTYGVDAAAGDANVDDVDAALTPDAGDVPAAPCGTISLLRDGFDDAEARPYFYRWSNPGVTVVETGGHVAIQVAAGSNGGVYGGYDSVFRYDLTGGELAATVTQVGGIYTTLELQDPDGRRIQMLVADRARLIGKVLDAPGAAPESELPYDPVAHRHWRIREADGTLYWETSPDRLAWSLLHSDAVPYPLTDVRGMLMAGGQVAGLATEARFEDVGPTPAADQPHCPIATLVDDFAAAPLPPRWDGWVDGDCTTTEVGGQVTLSFTGDGESYCGIDSRHLFALTGSSLFIDVAAAPATGNFVAFFQAVPPGDGETRIEIDREGTMLGFYQRLDGVNVDAASLLYDPVAHRYWRITEDAGTVRWQTSPDAVTWTSRHQAPLRFDASAVHLVAGAGTFGVGPGAPVAIDYRGINVP